jgi:hypothetical protein
LAALFVLVRQRIVEGRETRLTGGEWLAFYPVVAFLVGPLLFFPVFFIALLFSSDLAFTIGTGAISAVHYALGLAALLMLFRSPSRLPCPWTHRLGCWSTILSVACWLLHSIQRDPFWIDL